MTLRDAEKVQGATIQALLAAFGYNPGMPRAVVFGPTESGGLGLRHLFAEQGTIKTLVIIQQIRINRDLGKMLQIQLRWAQRVAGISVPILEDSDTRLPQLQGEAWLGTLREYLALSELGIKVQGIACPVMRRKGDKVLMDHACHSSRSDEEICNINRCRLYLRAESLSNLCNSEGTLIQQHAFDCKSTARITTEEAWPRQPRPGKQHRKVWKSFLANFCLDGTLHLRQTMGDWSSPPAKQNWYAVYDPDWEKAFTLEDDGSWLMRTVTSKNRRGWELCNRHASTKTDPTTIDWDSCIPTDILTRADGSTMISAPCNHSYRKVTTITKPGTWEQYVAELPEWERTLIDSSAGANSSRTLYTELTDENGHITIVSDGGQKGDHGTYGWVIGNDRETLWTGNGNVRGQPMVAFKRRCKEEHSCHCLHL